MNRNWYAVYTKPQCEKKVVAQLSKKKIENFCPHKRMIVGHGNKRKLVYEPLFPTFVFVLITEIQMFEVRRTNDVVNFVYWLGRPAIIKTEELENIAQFNGTYYNIETARSPINAAGSVKIITEPPLFESTPGVLSVNTRTIKLLLPSLGYTLTAKTGEKEEITEPAGYTAAEAEGVLQ